MNGFRFLENSSNIESCVFLEDEICNGGPEVWNELMPVFNKCLPPCRTRTYTDSKIEVKDSTQITGFAAKNQAKFLLKVNPIRRVERELLVYDVNDMIGSIGGSLGLFLEFSFFGFISYFIDKLFDVPKMLDNLSRRIDVIPSGGGEGLAQFLPQMAKPQVVETMNSP